MRTIPFLLCVASAALPGPAVLAQSANASAAHPMNPAPGATPAQTPNVTGAAANKTAMPKPHDPDPHASDNAKAVQAILQKFDASRDQVVAQRQALVDQLAAAKTDRERQAILAQLREEQSSIQEVQRATAKEIRAELQNLRRQRAGGG